MQLSENFQPERQRSDILSPGILSPAVVILPKEVNSHSQLTVNDIEQKMQVLGFPELRRHWEIFKKLGIEIESIEQGKLNLEIKKHSAPLFGMPLIMGGALCGLGALYTRLNGIGGMSILGGVNLAAIGAIGLTAVQRRKIYAMESLMARELAFMLSKPDFRLFHSNTERTKEFISKAAELGINREWDNPEYSTTYTRIKNKKDAWEKINKKLPEELILETLRKFLGYKDAASRKHVAGQYINDLVSGKKSVGEFVNKYSNALELNKKGLLPVNEGVSLLENLLTEYTKSDSKGHVYLKNRINKLKDPASANSGNIDVAVWERNPWKDLTHQEEFYSSASLRGIKPMGRGVKGRLGTFAYLLSPSITALDFSNSRGRQVRARLGAAYTTLLSGDTIPVLFVDGVEGSNSIGPSVIRQAIEDYGRASGFKMIVYNRDVHNQIPKRFVRFLETEKMPLAEIKISYLNSSNREYLDAFGLPLEPFEYAYPRGTVVGYISRLDESIEFNAKKPTVYREAVQFLRKNCLWIFCGEAMLAGGLAVGSLSPYALIPFLGAATGGLWMHLKYQKKGIKRV